MSTLKESEEQILSGIARMKRFANIKFFSTDDFRRKIDQMKDHFQNYEFIWLTGHFSNAFARKVQGLCHGHPWCDFRILAIDPKGNKANMDALIKMKKDGAEVKIHKNLHGRMMLLLNESTDTMTLIIGSYDYNREGMSGENVNIGLSTNNPEVIQSAKKFFEREWGSIDAMEIKNE